MEQEPITYWIQNRPYQINQTVQNTDISIQSNKIISLTSDTQGQTFSPDSDYDAMAQVTINPNIPKSKYNTIFYTDLNTGTQTHADLSSFSLGDRWGDLPRESIIFRSAGNGYYQINKSEGFVNGDYYNTSINVNTTEPIILSMSSNEITNAIRITPDADCSIQLNATTLGE